MMEQLIPLALSANTIALMWLAGNKHAAAWVLGLLGQTGWLAFVVTFEAWGLLPLCAALSVVYARNLYRWTKEGAPDADEDTLRQIKYAVWSDAYDLGVWDERTSQDWTNGQVPPARNNPYDADA